MDVRPPQTPPQEGLCLTQGPAYLNSKNEIEFSYE